MSKSGVCEVYRILQFEDGHVVLDRTPSTSDVESPVDLSLKIFRLGDKGLRFSFIRDIMLAWKIMTLEILRKMRLEIST